MVKSGEDDLKPISILNNYCIFIFLLNSKMIKHQSVDIEKVIKEKSPKLHKFTPSFIIKKLKKLLHEKEINQILKKLENKEGMEFIKGGLSELNVKSNSTGFEKIPKNQGVVIVANHPLGGLDGVTLINELGKYRNDIQFLVNDILTQIKPFQSYFVPINKHGANSRVNLNQIDKLYQSEKCIVIFPAGLVSRKQNNIIKDLEWKKSFITKAKKYNRPIYPLFVSGENSKRFYNISYWRKKIGIKFNIEMLFLADEMFKQKGNTIHFTIGKAIYPDQLSSNKTNHDWAQIIKEHVYNIKNNPNFELEDTIRNEKSH